MKAFGTNLLNNQGSFNETRISIVTSMKHQNVEFENISLFAVFEGHNGNECSTFLRDNLHVFIAMEKSFPEDIPKAMADGIAVAEQEFMKFARKTLCDAGSSLVVAIVKGDIVMIQMIQCTSQMLGTAGLSEASAWASNQSTLLWITQPIPNHNSIES